MSRPVPLPFVEPLDVHGSGPQSTLAREALAFFALAFLAFACQLSRIAHHRRTALALRTTLPSASNSGIDEFTKPAGAWRSNEASQPRSR